MFLADAVYRENTGNVRKFEYVNDKTGQRKKTIAAVLDEIILMKIIIEYNVLSQR